uniref:Metallo-beta-lactamase domain-containing protein n=1 Tax=Leersia perrieri TaxID=77586 RepID=A0A0D9VDP3_9ORYZ
MPNPQFISSTSSPDIQPRTPPPPRSPPRRRQIRRRRRIPFPPPPRSSPNSTNPSSAAAMANSGNTSAAPPGRPKAKTPPLTVEGYPVEGISIGGQETCVIFPTLSVAFDIGRCPQRAVSQEFLFISHAHLDHIGGLPMYVATRGLYRQRPPTIFIPACIRDPVERLFELHRSMDQSELRHNLVPLEVGEEYEIRRDLKVKAFRTYHVIPSQGYVIYTVKQKLKPEYLGLPGNEIKRLKLSVPEIAFTGDTVADFILDPDNADVLKARILVVESTFVDDSVTIEHAREYGHTHLFEILNQFDKLENKAIVLIHFSARYTAEEIDAAINKLPPSFRSRVHALKEVTSRRSARLTRPAVQSAGEACQPPDIGARLGLNHVRLLELPGNGTLRRLEDGAVHEQIPFRMPCPSLLTTWKNPHLHRGIRCTSPRPKWLNATVICITWSCGYESLAPNSITSLWLVKWQLDTLKA